MKLSTKARYGLRAVLEIARTFGSENPAKRKQIAATQSISDSYLENILIILKNSGIIDTTRGINGGYILNRAPGKINLFEVVTALEGPLDLVDCVGCSSVCAKTETCPTRSVWKQLADSWRTILENQTIQDLLDRESAVQSPSYSI